MAMAFRTALRAMANQQIMTASGKKLRVILQALTSAMEVVEVATMTKMQLAMQVDPVKMV
jgi:hypothetical protein